MKTSIAHSVMLVALIGLFCQCNHDRPEPDGYGSEYPRTKEAYKIVDNGMSYMNSDPAKAHHIIDSVCEAKMMSPQRCDFLHATVLYNGEELPDSALSICNRLLDEKKFGDDQYLEEEICVLASNITNNLRRHIETLKYAERGIAICHGHEMMRSDEATLIGRVGMAQQMLGNTKKALETYDKAYDILKEDKSFGGLIAKFSLMMKQAALYSGDKDYDRAIRIHQSMLNKVQQFDLDPSSVTPRPETMRQSGGATRDFADFYECQIYGNIASAYRKKIENGRSENPKADADSVAKYVDLWSKTTSSHAPTNLAGALPNLYFTGRKADFDNAKIVVADSFDGDTLVSDYVEFLTLLARDAASNHDLSTSNSLLQRALVVSDSIRQHDMLRTLSEQMSLNMVQEQQLARQDAENEVARQRLVILLLSSILAIILLAGLVIAFLIRKNKEKEQIIEITQQDLTDTKEEVKELTQQLEETKSERAVNNTNLLYERIQQAMTERKLYLNPDLDVKLLAEELCSSRTLISVCINSSTGKTFRQWLSEYRLSLFVKMLKANPDAPIEELMRQCGYKDQSTFRRQFKSNYGMTAGEYRNNTKENQTD